MIEAKETLVGQISSNQNLSGELLPRGPKGDKGEKGDKGDKGDTGAKGADGKDGAIQYEAGENITIEGNVISAKGGGGGLPVIYIGSDNSNSNPFVIDLDTLQNGTVIVLDKSLNNFFITMKGTNNVQSLAVNDVRVYMFANIHSTTPTDYSKFEPLRLIQLDSRVTMINPQYTYMTFGFWGFYVSGTVLVCEAYSLYSNDIVTNNKSSEISAVMKFRVLPKSGVTPTEADQFTRKGYVDTLPTTYAGYDATKTQVLKNINGVLTWQDE